MFLKRKSSNWNNIGNVKNSWKTLGGVVPDRLVILGAVWKKELGRLGEHCELVAVDRGHIVVRTESSVVYNELAMRSKQIIRGLNKYFPTPWLKGIRTSAAR